jgi:hypothetical protein
VSGNFDDFSGEKKLTCVSRKVFSTRVLLFVAIIVCALSFASLAQKQSVAVHVRGGAVGTDEVLGEVALSAITAQRSMATRVLAGSMTAALQAYSPNALIDVTGTAATPAGKTVTNL